MRSKNKKYVSVLVSLLVLSLVLLTACSSQKPAQDSGDSGEPQKPDYPTHRVDLIVPYAPGSSIDTGARLVADYATKKWNKPVTVVNMPGGSGIPGVLEVMNSAPDGYNLLMDGHVSTSMLKAAQVDLPFKIEDRTYMGRIITVPVFFAVNAESSFTSLQEVMDFAKANPDKFKWGAGTLGSINNFSQTQLLESAGVDPNKGRVIFEQGNAQAIAALLGNQVQFGIATFPDMMNLGKAGKIKAFAVTTPERVEEFPDVPTTVEAGFPKSDVMGWYGVSGPQGIDQSIADAWSSLLEEAAEDPAFLEAAANVGHLIGYMSPEDLKAQIEKEYEVYLKIALDTGLRKE